MHIARSAYYKWLKRKPSESQIINEEIAEWIKVLHEKHNRVLGYRRMTITINREYEVSYNRKRIYRLMNILNLKSVLNKSQKKYKASTPEITAENTLNRQFHADKPNTKWLTDVTEFKYYVGSVS